MTDETDGSAVDRDSADMDYADVDFTDLEFRTGVSQTGADPDRSTPRVTVVANRRRKGSVKRRLAGAFVLMIALMSMGGIYAAFAQGSSAAQTGSSAADIAAGRQIFSVSCITCHGANLDGVTGRGPSLIGVGGAAAYFQVSTGRMPLVGQGAEADRKTSPYTATQIDQIVAYVQSIAGGPAVPTGAVRDDQNLAEGGELFRLNCASCHNFAGKGAPLSAGKVAPGLSQATDEQIYTAMLSGPENMPVFSDNQLTPTQKAQVVGYIQTLKASQDPGGHGLDRLGPVTEGLVVWVLGIGALMVVILWIGARS